jgi:hypothetical protein
MHQYNKENTMNKKDKLSVTDVVKGSAYDKVRAILRENDYTSTHDDGGCYNFTQEEIAVITDALMKHSSKEREEAQDYINFYNAMMQYANYISNTAANYERDLEVLAMYVDIYEMLSSSCRNFQLQTDKDAIRIEKSISIPLFLRGHDVGIFIQLGKNGECNLDIDEQGNLLETMYRQSSRTAHSLAVLKAWIEVGKELVGKGDNLIKELVPYSFTDYITPPRKPPYPKKYFISKEEGRDSTKEEEKFEVFPDYKFTSIDSDGESTARSILNVTLEQWQLSLEKVKEIKKRLKKL